MVVTSLVSPFGHVVILAVGVAASTRGAAVRPRQCKIGLVVVEGGAAPAVWGVAASAVLSTLAVVAIAALVAGHALGRRSVVLAVGVAICTRGVAVRPY